MLTFSCLKHHAFNMNSPYLRRRKFQISILNKKLSNLLLHLLVQEMNQLHLKKEKFKSSMSVKEMMMMMTDEGKIKLIATI